MEVQELLNQPIDRLELSPAFCRQSRLMGFENLGEMVRTPPEELVSKKEFSYTWLGELSEFLNKHQLLHLLQPTPGKSCG